MKSSHLSTEVSFRLYFFGWVEGRRSCLCRGLPTQSSAEREFEMASKNVNGSPQKNNHPPQLLDECDILQLHSLYLCYDCIPYTRTPVPRSKQNEMKGRQLFQPWGLAVCKDSALIYAHGTRDLPVLSSAQHNLKPSTGRMYGRDRFPVPNIPSSSTPLMLVR